MSQTAELSAAELVNAWPEDELSRVIYEYGEERYARRVAGAIVRQRPLYTTGELAEVVRRAVPHSRGPQRIDPATRTFQALRIAVNGELEHLRQSLEGAVNLLKPGGRLAVISFHSLEDASSSNIWPKRRATAFARRGCRSVCAAISQRADSDAQAAAAIG